MNGFSEKLQAAVDRNHSLLCVELDPNPELKRDGDTRSWRTWLQWLISETVDVVCAYELSLSYYQTLGSKGMELLDQTIMSVPPHIPVILDAKHADLGSSAAFARTIFEEWEVDAVTLAAYAGQDCAAPFLLYPHKMAFVLCSTANESAAALQQFPSPESPFYLQLVKEAQTWDTPDRVGIESSIVPAILSRVRDLAPERTILCSGGFDWEAIAWQDVVAAGLSTNGDGLIIPAPPERIATEKPGEAIDQLRQEMETARSQTRPDRPACSLWLPNVCTVDRHPHHDLILQLFDIGCILFGDYVQASGRTFPYYIDLRRIVSQPQAFHLVLRAYAAILETLEFDRIAGIPYGGLPTATGLSLHLNRPLVFPRKEVKAHGTKRVVEGNFNPGETVVVIDDILISGNSAIEGAQKLESTGLNVNDIVVFIDHGNDVKGTLQEQGYHAHAVVTLQEMVETLYEAGRMTEEQYNAFSEHEKG